VRVKRSDWYSSEWQTHRERDLVVSLATRHQCFVCVALAFATRDRQRTYSHRMTPQRSPGPCGSLSVPVVWEGWAATSMCTQRETTIIATWDACCVGDAGRQAQSRCSGQPRRKIGGFEVMWWYRDASERLQKQRL